MFNGCAITTENYSNALIMFAASGKTGLDLGKVSDKIGGLVKYSADAADAKALLIQRGWTIKDGGQE